MEQHNVIFALPISLAAATSSPSLRQRGPIASSRGLALPVSLAAATSRRRGRGGVFIASSRGLGLELLVVAASPLSPQQAGNWPRGFHQSQKTVSSALQAYRTCCMAATQMGRLKRQRMECKGTIWRGVGGRGGGGDHRITHVRTSQPFTRLSV